MDAYTRQELARDVKFRSDQLGSQKEFQARASIGSKNFAYLVNPERPYPDLAVGQSVASWQKTDEARKWYSAMSRVAATLGIESTAVFQAFGLPEPTNAPLAFLKPRRTLSSRVSKEKEVLRGACIQHVEELRGIYSQILEYLVGTMSPNWTLEPKTDVAVDEFLDGLGLKNDTFDLGIGVAGSPRRELSGLAIVPLKGLTWSLGAVAMRHGVAPQDVKWRDVIDQKHTGHQLYVLQDDIGAESLLGQQRLRRKVSKIIERSEVSQKSSDGDVPAGIVNLLRDFCKVSPHLDHVFVSDATTCGEIDRERDATFPTKLLTESHRDGYSASFPIGVAFPFNPEDHVLVTRAVNNMYSGIYLTMADLYAELGKQGLPGLRLDFFELPTIELTTRFWVELMFQTRSKNRTLYADWIPTEAIMNIRQRFVQKGLLEEHADDRSAGEGLNKHDQLKKRKEAEIDAILLAAWDDGAI